MAVTFRASGPDRGPDKARDDSTLPTTFVPARRRTVPFTTTSLSSCAANFFPTRSCEEIVSSVRTTKVVPAGIVAANNWGALKAKTKMARTLRCRYRRPADVRAYRLDPRTGN